MQTILIILGLSTVLAICIAILLFLPIQYQIGALVLSIVGIPLCRVFRNTID